MLVPLPPYPLLTRSIQLLWTGTQPGGCRVATIPPAAGAGFKTPQDRDALDVGKVTPQSFASQLSISGGGGGV